MLTMQRPTDAKLHSRTHCRTRPSPPCTTRVRYTNVHVVQAGFHYHGEKLSHRSGRHQYGKDTTSIMPRQIGDFLGKVMATSYHMPIETVPLIACGLVQCEITILEDMWYNVVVRTHFLPYNSIRSTDCVIMMTVYVQLPIGKKHNVVCTHRVSKSTV